MGSREQGAEHCSHLLLLHKDTPHTMAWTWTGFKYDPVFRFKDKDFFQPGLNQAEARFWKLKIHKEIDRRGTKSSIRFTEDEEDLEKDCASSVQSMKVTGEDTDDEDHSDQEILDTDVPYSQYQYMGTSTDSTRNQYTPVQYNTDTQYNVENLHNLKKQSNTDRRYSPEPQYRSDRQKSIDKQYSVETQYSTEKKYSNRQYRNPSVSSVDSGMVSMRSSSLGSSKDYQYSCAVEGVEHACHAKNDGQAAR